MGPQAPGRQRRRGRALHGRRQGRGRGGGARDACSPIASACGATPRWATWRSGTTASTSAPCSTRSRPRCGAAPSACMDKARTKGHMQVLDKLTEEVDGEHRIVEDVPLIVRETHSDDGLPADEATRPHAARLHRFADRRPPRAAVALSHRRRGAQGGGRRQRRHELLGGAAAGRRRRRSAVPAGQAGAAFGAGALRRDQAARSPTRASAWWSASA